MKASKVPIEVLLSRDLRPLDKVIYAITCSRLQVGYCLISTEDLAEELGASVRVTQLAVQRLKKFDFFRRSYGHWKSVGRNGRPRKDFELVHKLRLLPNGELNPDY